MTLYNSALELGYFAIPRTGSRATFEWLHKSCGFKLKHGHHHSQEWPHSGKECILVVRDPLRRFESYADGKEVSASDMLRLACSGSKWLGERRKLSLHKAQHFFVDLMLFQGARPLVTTIERLPGLISERLGRDVGGPGMRSGHSDWKGEREYTDEEMDMFRIYEGISYHRWGDEFGWTPPWV